MSNSANNTFTARRNNDVRTVYQPSQFGDAERFLSNIVANVETRDRIRRRLAEKAIVESLRTDLLGR